MERTEITVGSDVYVAELTGRIIKIFKGMQPICREETLEGYMATKPVMYFINNELWVYCVLLDSNNEEFGQENIVIQGDKLVRRELEVYEENKENFIAEVEYED